MISIVIPVLNEEKFLGDCLKSVLEQDYAGEYEVVVVDNGSTDRTVEIARKLGARVTFSETKRNVFLARREGAFQARGEIVVQADADTLYPKDWLAKIGRHFADPRVVAVAGVFVYREPMPLGKIETLLRHFTNLLAVGCMGRPGIIAGANFAFRREAFLKVRGYDVRLYAPDQYGIASQLSRVGKVVYDRGLSCRTSPRRVRKPNHVIIRDFCVNVFRGFSHALYDSVSGRLPVKKAPLLRLSLVALLLLAVGLAAEGYFNPGSTVFGKVYSKARPGARVIALTFDDGPNEPYTSQIIDILDSQGIKATFFFTGKNVELYPDTARRVVAEGHVLGNHSYSHDANHALTIKGARDVEAAQRAIYSVVGVAPHFYRPPHGKKSPWELAYLQRDNIVAVNWSIATNELHTNDAQAVAERIVRKARPGGIIDLHDGYGNEHGTVNAAKSLTVEALPLIIKSLQDKGYAFVTVAELIGQPPYNRAGG
ncbi:MAG: glycosyltransferase [Chloroflexi bacterium]|nr:glycosyltransferase [Chloroflexota bacterium]